MNLHQRPDTLTECDREPIHHIAAVQPFGGLIAAKADGTIAHASANCAELLGLAAQPAPGTPLGAIFAAEALALIEAALARAKAQKEAVEAKNTETLTAAQQAQIDAAEARRRRAAELADSGKTE